jgi:hypothetical protein
MHKDGPANKPERRLLLSRLAAINGGLLLVGSADA